MGVAPVMPSDVVEPPDVRPAKCSLRKCGLVLWATGTALLVLADQVSDVFVMVAFFESGHALWGWIAFGLVVAGWLASLTMTIVARRGEFARHDTSSASAAGPL